MSPDLKARLVFTNRARCRNCYRCLRVCPVKAIRIQNGQAQVEASLCIACGTCRRECPQQAKSFRSDVERVAQMLQEPAPVAVSLAPSYASVYPGTGRGRLVAALRRLGFFRVEETALGAEITAAATAEFVRCQPGQAVICSACPAVVHYVEMYLPELVPALVPVVSPMVAHARLLKQRWGQKTRVVFIGPCLAKKMEAERPEYADTVDAVLTFEELDAWLKQENLSPETLAPETLDAASQTVARCFPLLGGLAKTAAWGTDLLADRVAAVSGFEMIDDLFRTLLTGTEPWIVEPLFCREGCINGPGIPGTAQVYQAKRQVLDYAVDTPGAMPPGGAAGDCRAHHQARAPRPAFGENEILAVLAQTGKSEPADQLNCGACGYNSCRDKAVAVLRGMAEPEMCIPQMLRQAENRTDKIIETTPNGIVILDDHLQILSMNLAFRAMFQASDAVLGKPVAGLLDPADFEKIASRAEEKVEGRAVFPNYQLVCHQILYPLKEDRQIVGIFVNLTDREDTERVLKILKQETIRQSQELLDHQIRMAQGMVKFLGENTAQAELLVRQLTDAALAEPPAPPER
jgi:iron only hydrogenase large subunit-like protein/uncharacterized Fe-S cluster-containing protein